MDQVLLKGRWQNSSVARIYISDGLSFLPKVGLSARFKRLLKRYETFRFGAQPKGLKALASEGTWIRIKPKEAISVGRILPWGPMKA